jgi:hypothetical protein
VVLKPSAGPRVIGLTWFPASSVGSGEFMISSTRWFCHPVKAHATQNAITQKISRLRSSSRWSTTDSRSS